MNASQANLLTLNHLGMLITRLDTSLSDPSSNKTGKEKSSDFDK